MKPTFLQLDILMRLQACVDSVMPQIWQSLSIWRFIPPSHDPLFGSEWLCIGDAASPVRRRQFLQVRHQISYQVIKAALGRMNKYSWINGDLYVCLSLVRLSCLPEIPFRRVLPHRSPILRSIQLSSYASSMFAWPGGWSHTYWLLFVSAKFSWSPNRCSL
jgi:hypothetical protein